MVSDWKGEAGVHCADLEQNWCFAFLGQWGWLVLETVDWHARFGTVQLATLVVSLDRGAAANETSHDANTQKRAETAR